MWKKIKRTKTSSVVALIGSLSILWMSLLTQSVAPIVFMLGVVSVTCLFLFIACMASGD